MKSEKELFQEIASLKKSLGAVVVAHNYQRPWVQDVADYVGDSLELARYCRQLQTDTIVFCGVRFMAETAAILNPESTVLLPGNDPGCPMADMLSAQVLREWKLKYPEAAVVCYVNSNADVKAESDICCTSANAVKIVNSLEADEILFVPDQNLGQWVASHTDKKIHLYPGYCYVHHGISRQQIQAAKALHPEAAVMVHPECRPEVTALADAVLSTSQMMGFAQESPRQSFIVGTEEGMLHRLKQVMPEKEFYIPPHCQVCRDMKQITLGLLAQAMAKKETVVTVSPGIGGKAALTIEKMLEVN